MTLDLYSVSVMTAAVVLIVGIIYISETLIRRDEVTGRHWSIAFLAGILTTIAYAIWAGIGVVLIALIGWIVFSQKLDTPAIIGISMILGGVVVLNVFSSSLTH